LEIEGLTLFHRAQASISHESTATLNTMLGQPAALLISCMAPRQINRKQ